MILEIKLTVEEAKDEIGIREEAHARPAIVPQFPTFSSSMALAMTAPVSVWVKLSIILW